MSRRATIRALEIALPEGVLTNAVLAPEIGWTPEKIEAKTGIASRHVTGPDECASDLAVVAAQRLFDSMACTPGEIDFILFCTQSPDFILPTTACLIQQRLGIPTSSGALDFNLGCSGYVYGLSLAKGLVLTGQATRVLLLTADTYTKYIHPHDRSVRTIFGDGASATLIAADENETAGLGEFIFGTDGSGARNLIVPTSGLRDPPNDDSKKETEDASGNIRSRNHLFMDGAEIFSFTLREVPRAVASLLTKAGLTLDDVDYFIFHQANTFMLEHLRKKMSLPREKFVVTMRDTGNTVSSTIPIALKAAISSGKIVNGSRLMLVGFGVGYSWAGCLVTWRDSDACSP